MQRLYGEYEGRIRYVLVPYIRTYSQDSENAALAAMAAWDQGKFWEMHQRLLEETPALGRPILDGLAREIGLDMKKYLGAMDKSSHLEEIRGNLERIHELGIWSTPTVIINGRVIIGAQAYGKYKEIVDEALAQ